MSPTTFLEQSLTSGVHRIGQIEIRATGSGYQLFHADDLELVDQPDHGLTVYRDPEVARDISTYAEDGTYRFTKGQTNLKRGWIMLLDTIEDTRRALDHFYPAALGLVAAQREGTLQIETLREKLNRQTGMYRFARNISDAGAQKLVQEVCGPAHQCAKWILWKLDAETPLDDSEASRFRGVPGNLPETEAIPLVCREACNHFVAECRKVSKAEHAAANPAG